jgi:hypothetical protein
VLTFARIGEFAEETDDVPDPYFMPVFLPTLTRSRKRAGFLIAPPLPDEANPSPVALIDSMR